MPTHAKKPSHHHPAKHHHVPVKTEMPPMGLVTHSPRSVLSQIMLPFALATLVGVALCAGTVHIYRIFLSRPSAGKMVGGSVLAPRGSSSDINRSLEAMSALYVDPIDLVKAIGKGNKEYTLVDVRSPEQFERSHIKTAINMPDVSKSMSHIQVYPVILYGTMPLSQPVLRAVSTLASSSKDVRILSIGWNEFRYFPNLWIPEDQWNTIQIDDYVQNAEPN